MGWKIFKYEKGELLPMTYVEGFDIPYQKSDSRWIKWLPRIWNSKRGDLGFCFLLSGKTADSLLALWSNHHESCVIREIEYKKGLGHHLEDHIISDEPFDIALCQEFRIVEE